jgi:hypothetical protein
MAGLEAAGWPRLAEAGRGWPRLAEAWGSLRRGLALRGKGLRRASRPRSEPPCYPRRGATYYLLLTTYYLLLTTYCLLLTNYYLLLIHVEALEIGGPQLQPVVHNLWCRQAGC